VFAVLHLEAFALQAALRAGSPVSGTQPAGLLTGLGRQTGLAECNRAARAAGLSAGISVAQALARCPELLLRAAEPAAEAEAGAVLLAAALTLSPTVEATAAGCCTIDLRGTEPAGRRAAAEAAVRALAATGLQASAGVARTPRLAAYAARWAGENALPGGFLAVEDEESFLATLPIDYAEPTPAQAARLAGWGVRTLGELTALTAAGLTRRLGREGRELWDRARGGEPRPLRRHEPPTCFHADADHEAGIETLPALLPPLQRHLARLALELQAAGLAAGGLVLELRLEDGPPHRAHLRLPAPTASAGPLQRALETHLTGLRTAAAVKGWSLRVEAVRAPVRQQDFLSGGLRDPHAFTETLARVAALVGADRVGTPVPVDTHRPDAAALGPPPGLLEDAPAGPSGAIGLPLRRFRPPLPARLTFAPASGWPAHVWTERFSGPVTEARGPWCASGEWWEPARAWARVEWDVALAGGGLYRILGEHEAWFVEGEYD
jgi:protein ImuB